MTQTGASLAIGRSQGTVVVTVGGEFDAGAMARLQDLLVDLIDGQGNVAVEVDLTRVAAGTRMIAAFAAVLRERFRGRNLTVREPAPARRSQAKALR
jgi:hypothetical protein